MPQKGAKDSQEGNKEFPAREQTVPKKGIDSELLGLLDPVSLGVGAIASHHDS